MFTAENTKVEIYNDDGSGSPIGSPILNCHFKRSVVSTIDRVPESFSHLGIPFPEVVTATPVYVVMLEKLLEDGDSDLFDIKGLCYIKIIVHDDYYKSWVSYEFGKSRVTSIELSAGDSGAMGISVTFTCERIYKVNLGGGNV